jgi:hypothetical protein
LSKFTKIVYLKVISSTVFVVEVFFISMGINFADFFPISIDRRPCLVLFILLLLCAYLPLTSGIIADTSMAVSTPHGVGAVLTFGMARGGSFSVNYTLTRADKPNIEVTPAEMSTTNLQYEVLIVTEAQRSAFYYGLTSDVNTTQIDTCMNPVTFRRQITGKGKFIHTIGNDEPDAEQYSVLLVQCRTDGNTGYLVNATIHTDMVNPKPYSTDTTHLPIDGIPHLAVDIGLIIVYFTMFAALLGQMWMLRQHVTYIHYCFVVTLIIQAVDIIVDYYYYIDASKTGVSSFAVGVISDIIDYTAETCILGTFLLLSMGWNTLQFRLSQKQLMRVLGGLGSFIVMGIGSSTCADPTGNLCQSIYLITHVVRALLLLAIIICLNFTITQLRSMLAHSPWDPSTPYYYARARQFQTFRIVFILYLIFPTGFLLVQDLMFTWKESWINFMLLELRNVLLFATAGTIFAPFQDAFLTRAFDGTFSNGPQGNRPHDD